MLIDRCLLFGAGGHAKVVLEALRMMRPEARVEVRDDDPAKHGVKILGHAVSTPCLQGDIGDVDIHVAIGVNDARRRLALASRQAGASLFSIVHPAACLSPSATMGHGVFVAAMAVIGAESRIDEGVIVNHGAIVDHDCRIGAWTHVAPRAVLGGGVRIGAGVLLGSGCIVLPGLEIGEGATVGAGAVVTRSVPPGITIMGVPAK